MLLVSDSGSTKADWLVIDNNGKVIDETSTMGFNPFFHDEDIVFSGLQRNDILSKYADSITRTYFYGAGCSSPDLRARISRGMQRFFPNSSVTVDHDLAAAAYATANGKPSIACILGTGSNSCYFDGEKVIDDIPALGYILGDEGSGSYFGKKLLALFLYKKLPSRIHRSMEEKYQLDKKTIFENVYMKPHANVYLASFASFLSDNRNDVFVENLISNGLLEFISMHVCRFENYREVPAHFVGSIAYFFEDNLREVAKRRDVTIGKVIKAPVYALKDYHTKQLQV